MVTSKKILENEARLSQSILWKLEDAAYLQFGIDAWNKHGVPSYITSNTSIAKKYAHVFLGYLRDCLSQSLLDLERPIYLLDLGAGTGCLAYFFLKELFKLLHSSSLPTIKICYVMTEIVPSTLDYWQQHPYLKPYFEQGVLDCAYYHDSQSDLIHLVNRDEILSKEMLINPIVLICNYFFDTIPQDLFRFKAEQLEEGRITLTVKSEESDASILEPSIINQLDYHYSYHPVSDAEPYYKIPELNLLLESYRKNFENCPFLFPLGSFKVLNMFIELSGSRLLLLAGDRGVCTEEQVRKWGEPKIAQHGSFSLPVDFYAIANFFNHKNGITLFSSFSDPAFITIAAVLDNKSKFFPETTLAYREHLDSFDPLDYFRLVSLTEEKWENAPLDQVLLLVKLGNWDSNVLFSFFSIIRQALPTATEKQKKLLVATIECAWENFYPISSSSSEFLLGLGLLLLEMKEYKQSSIYFNRSKQIAELR